MTTFTPCKVNFHGTSAVERAPVCGMSQEQATRYAVGAYGADAGIECDETRVVTWVGDARPAADSLIASGVSV